MAPTRTRTVLSIIGLALAFALSGCGDDGGAPEPSASAADPSDGGTADGTEPTPEASGSTAGLPDWWPATLPLPDGFALETAAQDLGTDAVLDLTGAIDGMDAATAADVFEESAQANGWTFVDRVNVPLRVTYTGPDGAVTIGFSDIEGGAAVLATLDPGSSGNTDDSALPGPIDPGAADGPGVAVVTVAGVRYQAEGECTGFTFRDFDGMADGVIIEVLAQLDSSGTAIEFSGAGFTIDDGATWSLPATPAGAIEAAPRRRDPARRLPGRRAGRERQCGRRQRRPGIDRGHVRLKRSVAPALTLALATIVAALASTGVAAQNGGEPAPAGVDQISLEPIPPDQVSGGIALPDGDYQGSIGLDGSFRASTPPIAMLWIGSASGPLEFSVDGGVVSGTWTMNGLATFHVSGVPVQTEAQSTFVSTGTLAGSGSGPYVMSSPGGTGTSTATVVVPVLGEQTQTTTFDLPPATVEWERVLEVCGQVLSSWDQLIANRLEGLDLVEGRVRTYALASSSGTSELQERVEQLVVATGALQASLDDPDLTLVQMASLVLDAEELLADVAAAGELECQLDDAFMRLVTLQVQDVLHTLLVNWESYDPAIRGIALRKMVQIGLRAGALGAGSPDPVAAAHLEGLAAEVAQREYERVVGADDLDLGAVEQLAVVGTVLGIEYVNADGSTISGSDLCLALGCGS